MKIVYFIPHLREASGMNRVLSIKANYLADVLGYKISIITYRQHDSVVFFPFSPKINLIHLNLDDPSFRLKSLSFVEKRRQIRQFMFSYQTAVEKYLFSHKTDICISMFLGAEYKFLDKIKDGSRKILEVHLNFEYSPFFLLTKSFKLSKILSRYQVNKLKKTVNRFEKIVVLTKGDAENWRRFFDEITVIQNPITVKDQTEKPSLFNKKAIAVGRLENEKGFDFLIDAWKIVNTKHPEWSLNIYGEGNLRQSLEDQIRVNKLEGKVILNDAVSNITEKYLESSVFILSSRHEGFVLVLLEALSLGIPSVSFDCKYGPSELIKDGENGFLAEPENIQMLAAKINLLIENESLRQQFSEKSIISTKKYTLPKIMGEWDLLFQSLLNNN